MKRARRTPTRAGGSSRQLSELRTRLAEAEETLRAISAGEVDALVTTGKNGPQVFTLEGADHAYRELIESMNEGALTLTTSTTILYANQCFARMVKCPLKQVMGSSFCRFLSADDQAALEPLMQRPGKSGSKLQVLLNADDGTQLPVQISIRPLPKTRSKDALLSMVVADMTQARRIEKLLRTERRRTVTALRKSDAKLTMAFASMTEAMFIADASGRLTDFNDEFVRYHRFKNRDECSRTIADFPKYLEAYLADGTPVPPAQWALASALRGETASNVEYRLCRKETGETWWGSYSFGPIHDKEGSFVGAVVCARDVTERKELEQEKAEALRLLDTLLTHAPVGFAFFDLDLRFVRINERLATMNGFSVAAHLGRSMAEILPTLAPALKEMAAHIVASGQPALDHEFTGETASAPGVTRYWNASWYPVCDERGEIIGFGAVVDDITERKRAEEALRHNERRFRGIFDSAFQFIGLMSPDGTLLESNRAALEAGGLRVENVIGKPFWECDWWTLTERTGRELRTAIGRAASGELVRYNVDVRGADGQVITLDFSIKPIRDETGRVVLLIPEGRDITSLKQAEAALQESEKRFRSIAENQSEGLLLFDPQGNLLFENAASLKIHDFSLADLRIRPEDDSGIWQVWDEGGQALPMDQWPVSRALRGERVESQVLHVRRSDTGLEFDASYNGCPIYDASGKLTLVCITLREITGQRKAEKALAASRTQIQDIIDGTPAIVYAFDLEARFLLANAAVAKLFNVTPEQMIGKSRHQFEPKEADSHEENDRLVIKAGKPLEFEENSQLKGRSISWLTTKFPLRDPQGEIYAVAGISIDISERKRAEEVVRGSKAKLRDQLVRLALLEQITRAISSHLDFQGILKVVTSYLENNLPADFCCVCLFDEQARKCTVARVGLKSAPLALELAMPEQTVISLDCEVLSQAALGKLCYLPDVREMAFTFPQRLVKSGLRALVLAPLPLEDKVIGFLMVARHKARSFPEGECDFLKQLGEHVALAYHQAKLHDSLQKAYDTLHQTQQVAIERERLRALGQMASGIAHDISNAISPVTLYAASLLEHEPDLSVRARDYLQTIHHSVKSVAETISRMREFYRTREPQVILTRTHLNDLAQQALDLTRVRWSDSPQQRGIVIQSQIRLAEDLPDIMGVESEIRDAIINLIFNAVDAMPRGGALTLRTMTTPIAAGNRATPDARQACLEVIDTGIGMDEDTRRRCQDPFFTTKGEHGTGLGLAMVYGMIKRHSAKLEIQSTSGQGTTVRMIFPVAAGDSSVVEAQPWALTPEPVNQRILFIDDDPRLIQSMRDTLENDGHTVVTATGGQEGIHAFMHAQERNEAFSVVITDLGMPHVDGRKVASAIKAASPSTPVILLTGWGQTLKAEGDIPAEVDLLLCKPPNLRDLREALAACCPPGQSQPTKA